MGRPALVQPDDLLAQLSLAFRDVGFEAASMTVLSERTGLKRPSLYHRFPGGKEQMAQEVLSGAHAWLAENVLAPLRSDAPPAQRVAAMVEALGRFYEDGARACLLNMLSAPMDRDGPFAPAIRATFEAWLDALAACARDSGVPDDEARARARRVLTLVQGGLVLSRGLGTTDPFAEALADLPPVLLEKVLEGGDVAG